MTLSIATLCYYVEGRYAFRHGLFIIMLIVAMLNATMLTVVMLSVEINLLLC